MTSLNKYVPDNEATEWVSPIVMVKKPDDSYRLCVDMVQANKAIKRIRHVIPTIDELRHEYNGCRFFSKIDLNQGYHQFELDEKSRGITTFSTHCGLFRYKVLNFGTSSAAEIFHEEIRKIIAPIPTCVKNIYDDVLIGGSTKEECQKNEKKLLDLFRKHNITINLKKCSFCQPSVKFYGLIFSSDGIHPDPAKIEALCNTTTPKDKNELRSFLGMINFSAPFIPNYSTLTADLRTLLKNDVPWLWGEKEDFAFNNLKNQLCENSVLNYFDMNLKTAIICDASPVGLSAILAQYSGDINNLYTHPKIIAYSSRSLTPAESRYAQIEREALAVHFGCMKFEMYVIGSTFTVVTDHQPLVSLFNSPRRPGPFRVERIRLKLQGFIFKTVYKSGKWNPSDYLSRHPEPTNSTNIGDNKDTIQLECHHINHVTHDAITLSKIRHATLEDPILKRILNGLILGKLDKKNPEFKPYMNHFTELSTDRDLVLRGERIVVPASLVNEVVTIGHEGHQGIVKCKQFIRSRYWFPNMDSIIEKAVSKCLPCQAVVNTPVEEPTIVTELPEYPWQKIDLDFLGPLPSGDYLLVAIDEYSRFPEVFVTRSTAFNPTKKHLDKLLSSFGIPETIKSDNGPPFKSKQFKKYSRRMGFQHHRITPLHPKANGLVENFNKMLIKILKVARIQGLPWQDEMYTFLMNYRATPHLTTGKAPAELLFGRPFRTKLGLNGTKSDDAETREHDSLHKAKSKAYHDRKSYVKPQCLKKGDKVLVKMKKINKLTPNYDPKPYIVTERKGNMITATRKLPYHKITRNISFFKKLKFEEEEDDSISDWENDNEEQIDVLPPSPPTLRRSGRIRRPPVRYPDVET